MKNKKVISILGWILSIASIVYFVNYFKNNFSTTPSIDVGIYHTMVFLFLIILYVIGISVAALAWNMLLKSYGFSLTKLNVIELFFKAQFAKYLPGNIGHHVGRIFLSKKIGIPVHVTIQTLLIETAWFISISALLSLGAGYIYMFDISEVISLNGMIAFVLGCLFAPILIIKILNRYFSRVIQKATGLKQIVEPQFKTVVIVLLMQMFCFVVVGFIIDLLVLFVFDLNKSQLFYFTGVYALSWIAGYLVPGAPAGLGVRELVMIAMLEPLYGPGLAMSISVALRIVSALGDIVAFLMGCYLQRQSRIRTTKVV